MSNITCSEDACTADVLNKKRGLCKKHYEALQRAFPLGLPKMAVVSDCIQCGTEFIASHRERKWCSKACDNAWRDVHNTLRCSYENCQRGLRAKGMCHVHYRAAARADGRIRQQGWNERRQENRERRRARMKGVFVGPKAPRFKIADRDGWLCGLCGGSIPRVVKHGHPLYLTIDHIVPLSKGGEHSPSNVQAAHATCNYSKGDRELAA